MATPRRRADPPLEQVLFDEAYRFDFTQAVRLLERLAPDRAPVGQVGPPGREVARFRAQISLAFPPSELHHLERSEEEDAPPNLTVAFVGLTGPMGVLPAPYTELLIERRRQKDHTLAAFLDLFHHRVASLFFRAWEKYRVDTPRRPGADDRVTRALFSLIGLGLTPLRNRFDFSDDLLIHYAGLLALQHRSAEVLQSLLHDAFGLPVEVRQFSARWLRLEPDDCSRLGVTGRHQRLGTDLILGDRVRDEQGKFRLRLGPLTFDQFRALLPGTSALVRLAQLTRLFVGPEFDFDVQLILAAQEVPGCCLTSAPGSAPRLGRYAWLKSRDFSTDADNSVFSPSV